KPASSRTTKPCNSSIPSRTSSIRCRSTAARMPALARHRRRTGDAMKRLLLPTLMLATLAVPAVAVAGARAQLAGSLAAGQPTQLDVTVDGEASRAPDVHVPGAR